ncbi:pyridoxal phosphate-dependent aminotransferase [Lentzea sp. CA-135723]|uniref:pyridoxal phosphate-dependent aminotransferase n=1 Tax=Lentzea sp. CA-135723 TaxID=3239950 RepID=UPI003D8FE9CD
MIPHSATLAVNEKINARRAAGLPVLHLGFGEAGLPVHPDVAAALAGAVTENSYGPVAGTPRAREAAAGYLSRRGTPTDPSQIVLAPGSKPLLYALLAALPGDVVLPAPSWVSYAAQAQLTGKRVIGVPIPPEAGGVPDPDLLEPALAKARADGASPRILVLTLPDNPTGTQASAGLVERVCDIADRHDLTIISDEIYRDLTFTAHVSPATYLPGRTVVTGGLSKNMALGGWRVGFARIPDPALREDVIGIASEVWSSLAAPMQAAAAHVLDEPAEVNAHIAASRRLHESVVTAAHRIFVEAGALCRPPTAGFYLYPDLEPLRPGLNVTTGVELTDRLLDEHGIGVLAGEHFGDAPEALRFRVATSLLYGRTAEQRWEALRSDDPVTLPWIADSLAGLGSALARLG